MSCFGVKLESILEFFVGLGFNTFYRMITVSNRGHELSSISNLRQNNFVTISDSMTVHNHKNTNLLGILLDRKLRIL